MAFDAFETNVFRWNMRSDKVLNIVFFGDLHDDCSDSIAEEQLEEIRKRTDKLPRESVVFYGMGDYGDFMSTSERRKVAASELHESTVARFDKLAMEDLERRVKSMEFMRGRLVGLHCGNHDFMFSDGRYASEILAHELGCKHLGYTAYTRIMLTDVAHKGNRSYVDVFSSHGKGSGRLIGSPFNTVAQMANIFPNSDFYCVSDDTEILTMEGWKRREALTDDDVVGAFDTTNNQFKWSRILDRVEFPYEGDAIRFKNKNVDCLMHPKHRVVYRHFKDWHFKEAEKFLPVSAQLKIPVAGSSPNEKHDISDSLLALCGWIVSEGSFGPSGIRITQKVGDKSKEIEAVLLASGLEFTKNLRKDGYDIFYITSGSRHHVDALLDGKNIPKWLYSCSDRQFDIFLDALVKGDGHWFNPNCASMYQASERFMDDLQGVCCAHGWRTSKRYKKGGFKEGGWVLNMARRSQLNLALTLQPPTIEPYNGMMWCVTTEYSTFIARRNGQVFVTGNCQGHDHSRGGVPATTLYADYNVNTGDLDIKERTQMFIRSGSSLRGYTPRSKSYISKALYKPCALGFPIGMVEFKRIRSGGADVTRKTVHCWS